MGARRGARENEYERSYSMENSFETMKKKQKLSVSLNARWVSFNGFYLAVKESLVSCKTRESTNVMMFTINGTDGMGTLASFEDLGNKLVETLRIDFVPYTERDSRGSAMQ